MNLYLWVVQAILALIFFLSGMAKLTMSRSRMAETGQTGAAALPLPLVRFVAVCEIAGAFGITLPTALHLHQWLTPFSALGFAIIMLGAACIHLRLGERKPVLVNAALFLLCSAVIAGRR